ncbi:hypothetical protein ACFW04_008656 [Cataglyphis niger]
MRISVCTISRVILETSRIIYTSTNEEWAEIANNYFQLWNVSNLLFKDGSLYYNYKSTNSIVLLAAVDALYQFIYVNIGINGRISDGGVFRRIGNVTL